MTNSPTFLLVHGAWHGAWCWQRLTPELKKLGLRWQAPDLPGLGQSQKRWGWRISMAEYGRAVADFAKNIKGDVVPVGHSMGGLVISSAAERSPHRFRALIYLAAFLPQNGDSLMSLIPADESADFLKIHRLRGEFTIHDEALVPGFYEDCSAEDIALAKRHLRPQAMPPFREAVSLSEERFGRLKRYYIACKEDKAIRYSNQIRMVERVGCEKRYDLPSAHSPFFSHPKLLAECLKEIETLIG